VFLGSKQFFKFSLIHRFCVSVFVIFFIFWGFFEQLFVNVPPCFRYTLIVATFYRFLFLSLSPSLSLTKFFSFSFHFLTFVFFLYMSTYLCCFKSLSLSSLIFFSFYLFLRLSVYLIFSLFLSIFLPLYFFSICQFTSVVLNPSLSSLIFFSFVPVTCFLFPYIDLTFSIRKFYFHFFSSVCLFLILVLWSPLNLDDREWFFIFFYFLFSFLLLNHNFVKSENDVSTDLFVEWKPWKKLPNERNEIKESVSL
jgi:hypothetical protein